jgi:hypothetical protein
MRGMLVATILLHSFASQATEKKVTGHPGERCSTMCPRAEKYARADCEEKSKSADIKNCECTEETNPPYAEIVYACKGDK